MPDSVPPDPAPPTPPTPPTPPAASPIPPAPPVDDAAALRAKLEASEAEARAGKEAQAELARIKAEQAQAEQKRLEQQGEFKTLAEQRANELKAKDQRILRAEVRAAAIAEGIVDRDLVQLIPIDENLLANGEPDLPKIQAAVQAYKTSKPHLFKQAAPPASGAGAPPPPAPPSGGIDLRRVGRADLDPGKSRTQAELTAVDKEFREASRKLLSH